MNRISFKKLLMKIGNHRFLLALNLAAFILHCEVTVARFPDQFFWCSATAAHQVEGNNSHSDWWEFEKGPGHIKNNDRSGLASDQWHLIDTDIQRMKDLGLTSYRFSVEWAKIEPSEGAWDGKALAHYKKLVGNLRKHGIEPIVTLHHFTLPQWLALKGGWSSPATIKFFLRYAQLVFHQLHGEVNYWVTFNEPMVQITAGYLDGLFPPKLNNANELALKALHHILIAHAETVSILRSIDSDHRARFGFAHHLRVFDPSNRYNLLDRWMANRLDFNWNWAFTEALVTGRFQLNIPFKASIDVRIPHLAGSQDFFGLNYYSRDMVSFSFTAPFFRRMANADALKSDLGWEIYPGGLGRLLEEVHSRYPELPILITENGVADAKDQVRGNFIREHLRQVEQALSKGVPVLGYCHWSLIDNFEWAEGFSPRFGIYEVDYLTQDRKLRPSGIVFRDIIKKRSAN